MLNRSVGYVFFGRFLSRANSILLQMVNLGSTFLQSSTWLDKSLCLQKRPGPKLWEMGPQLLLLSTLLCLLLKQKFKVMSYNMLPCCHMSNRSQVWPLTWSDANESLLWRPPHQASQVGLVPERLEPVLRVKWLAIAPCLMWLALV